MFFLLLFAVCISVLGIFSKSRLSVLGLLLNLSLMGCIF
jgi:hypothetical protein